ncbi:unnamed protein product [Phyllotreta striolata]|uniref:Uncharacterized protein n=1 Tax=Phyllotreta striolata TaxID=444603 RepID=A0A9N9TUH7_PHYSR|nr:unnamed protein product [Phyllotreta striolata]
MIARNAKTDRELKRRRYPDIPYSVLVLLRGMDNDNEFHTNDELSSNIH